mmetsp:Transcript_7358/g.14143  ORF Transcript_7358/g.14143 Transcript_7358/m.14143 type:complete len:219 (-) Transcript_7358:2551-3207(-)
MEVSDDGGEGVVGRIELREHEALHAPTLRLAPRCFPHLLIRRRLGLALYVFLLLRPLLQLLVLFRVREGPVALLGVRDIGVVVKGLHGRLRRDVVVIGTVAAVVGAILLGRRLLFILLGRRRGRDENVVLPGSKAMHQPDQASHLGAAHNPFHDGIGAPLLRLLLSHFLNGIRIRFASLSDAACYLSFALRETLVVALCVVTLRLGFHLGTNALVRVS